MTAHLAVNNTGHPGTNIEVLCQQLRQVAIKCWFRLFFLNILAGSILVRALICVILLMRLHQLDHHSRVDVTMTNDQVDRIQRFSCFLRSTWARRLFDKILRSRWRSRYCWTDSQYRLRTVPGLVRVKNQDYQITDITLRMLQLHELAKAQGVPDDYILDRDRDGNKIAKISRWRELATWLCQIALRHLLELICQSYVQGTVNLICLRIMVRRFWKMDRILNYPGSKWSSAERIINLFRIWNCWSTLKNHRGPVILSGYNSDLYAKELKGWYSGRQR